MTAPLDPDAPAPARPARPVVIEVAAAVLIVGGAVGIIQRYLALQGAESPIAEVAVLLALFTVMDLLSLAVGLLVRTGRRWILALNVVAIEAFVYLTGFPNVALVFFGLVFGLVLVALIGHRPWFDAMAAWRDQQRRLEIEAARR